MGERGDVGLVGVDLGLHVGEADDAPGIVHAGVGEAELVGAGLLVLGGVDLLAAEILLPGLALRPLRGDREQRLLALELGRVVEVLGDGARRQCRQQRHQTDLCLHVHLPLSRRLAGGLWRSAWGHTLPKTRCYARRNTPGARRHRGDQDQALDGLAQRLRQAHQVEQSEQSEQAERAGDGAGHAGAPAEQLRPADDAGGDRLQLEPLSDRGRDPGEAAEQDARGDRRQCRDDEDQHARRTDRHAGKLRRARIVADRQHLPAEDGRVQQPGSEADEDDEDEHRERHDPGHRHIAVDEAGRARGNSPADSRAAPRPTTSAPRR